MSDPTKIDLRILELLSARICHDLISPVSAINNGVELVTELGDGMQGEVLELIGESARSASRWLQFYRAAFGSARGTDGAPLGLIEARRRTLDCLPTARIEIDWPERIEANQHVIARDGIKLLLNMLLVAVDLLPGAGRIRVGFEPGNDGLKVQIEATKDGLVLDDGFRRALAGSIDTVALTPRSVVAHLCWICAKESNGDLKVADVPGKIAISAMLCRA